MNLFKVIKTSYLKSLKGEEKFWVVVWLWGFLLYAGSIAIGFGMMLYHNFIKNILGYDPTDLQDKTIISDLTLLPFGMLGVFGLILLIIYPAVFIVSLFRCVRNQGIKKKCYAMIVTVIFSIFHSQPGLFLIGLGSFFFLRAGPYGSSTHYVSSISGVLIALALVIFTTVKTIKSLTKKL